MEQTKKGICYGVSVGSGRADLITPEAMNIIKSADVIFLPGSSREKCAAYKILEGAWPGVSDCDVRFVSFTMSHDEAERALRHDRIAEETMEILSEGKSVAFPTLGEVSLYSTYYYIHERLKKAGYRSCFVSGISSVQQVASRLGIALAQGDEMLHIMPASEISDGTLSLPGTKVFMKPGKNHDEIIGKIRAYAKKTSAKVYGVSNLGMEDEVLAKCADELKNLHGYFTIFVVKDGDTDGLAYKGKDPDKPNIKPDATYFENRACKYYPCHKGDHINCLFCYCPLYFAEDCPGEYKMIEKDGRKIKSCMDCEFPHLKENYPAVIKALKGK